MGVPIVWSAREKPIVDAAVQALIAGEYSTITGAARSCLEQLTALRREAPDAQSPRAPKTLSGVIDYLRAQTRDKRLHGPETYWTEAEDRVLRRHVGALLRGRYRSVEATTEASIREFERLRGSGGGWSPSPRTQRAVYNRVVDLARKAGRRPWRVPYAKAELDTFDRYARAVADGRYRDLSLAVTLCLKDLARLRRRQAGLPARPFKTIRAQISVRAHKLGWRWSAERWRPDERRIVDRYVRALTEGSQPSLYQATRDCLADLEALHLRLEARDSALRSSYRRRTFATLRTHLDRLSLSMGRRITQAWTKEEDEVAKRFARALLDGRYPDAHSAARDCWHEVAKVRRRWRVGQPAMFRRTRPRTLEAVYCRVCLLAQGLEGRWPGTPWTDAEIQACRQWIRWYDRYRGVRRLSPWKTVAQGLQEEVERLGCNRTVTACWARFRKEWKRQHGG